MKKSNTTKKKKIKDRKTNPGKRHIHSKNCGDECAMDTHRDLN